MTRFVIQDIGHLFLVKFLFTIGFSDICNALDVTLTVIILPAERQCFSQDLTSNSQYALEYQVVAGGELDVLFTVFDVDGVEIFEDDRKSSNVYRDRMTENGTLNFCFDNTFSHISSKTVFFHLTVVKEEPTTTVMEGIDGEHELLPFEIKLENFKTSTHLVSTNLRRSTELQRAFSQIELRDRSIQEYNFERVNFWSGLQLFIMMMAAIINVLMIRSLFADKRPTSSATAKLRI